MGEKEDNEIPKGPAWLTSWSFWIQGFITACGLVAVRYIMNGGHLY